MTVATQAAQPDRRPEYAYFETGVHWGTSEWPKNMLLLFDGIAILMPDAERDWFYQRDEALISGLENENVLRLLRPEDVVDRRACDEVVTAILDMMDEPGVQRLAHGGRGMEFHLSKLGLALDPRLIGDIVVELRKRDLAKSLVSECSIALHPALGILLLRSLSEHVIRHSIELGFELFPSTDFSELYQLVREHGDVIDLSNTTKIISTDFQSAGIKLGPVPIDEIVAFRREHKDLLDRYRLGLMDAAEELARREPKFEPALLAERREIFEASATELERYYRQWWKGKARMGMAAVGAVANCAMGRHLAAAKNLVQTGLALPNPAEPRTSRMTFVLAAGHQFGTI